MNTSPMFIHLLTMSIGSVSIVIALLLPRLLEWPISFYFLLGPAHPVFGYRRGSCREKLARSAEA